MVCRRSFGKRWCCAIMYLPVDRCYTSVITPSVLEVTFSCNSWKREKIFLLLRLRSCLFCEGRISVWNADSKRRSKTPLIQAIVRAQVNRKGVYMTSFKRGYNVILRSCFHQNQRFALTTIVNAHFWAAFMLILRRRFETLIQNADPNAVHGSTVHASLEKKTIRLPKKACLGILGMFNSGYCSSSSEPKGVYMTSFKRGYNVILRSCFHQNQRFALTTFVNANFWAFWIGVLKRVYSKISMDATAFCSNHVWKRWFWPQKLSINAP